MSQVSQSTTTPSLGITKDEIDTPALCVDLDVMEANIAAMAKICQKNGIDWRPHSKCHKSPAIAHKLIEAGAIGVTCAKLGEAEVMAAGGVTDLLIANLIVGPHKMQRLVELRRIADPIVCIDHIDQARPISEAMADAGLKVRAILELEIGLHRVGVEAGQPALALARQVAALPGIEFAGVMAYEGHLLMIPDQTEKAEKIHAALDTLVATKDLLLESGLPCPIVSCGGTGSYEISTGHPGITELQAGGAIFMDAFYRHGCHLKTLDYALSVMVTVVGRPAPERAIIDAGRKTMNREVHEPQVMGRDDIEIESLSAEHGSLKLAPSAQNLKIGDRLEFLPGYGDLTTVLHDNFYGFRDGRLEVIWPLEGRGKLQ